MADDVVGTTGPNQFQMLGQGTEAPTRPTPTVVAGEAPDVQPSVSDVLSGTTSPEAMAQRVARPATPATFKGTLRSALSGPQYTTDANGNIVPAIQKDKYGNPVKTSMSMRGILAGILAGAAQGAVGGMAAERKPGENPYSAGARGAIQMAKERDERARNIAQKNQENRQKQQQLNIEQAKQMDEHTTRLLTNAKISQETIAMEHEARYMDEMHPLLVQGEKQKLKEALIANRKNFDGLVANLVEAVGPDAVELPGAGHSVLTQDHARDAAQGWGPMYGTEQHGGEFGYGIVDYEALENSPLKKDVPVYRNVINPQTGVVTKELMTTIHAGEPAYKALDIYNAGMDQFYQQYKVYADGLEAQAKKAEVPLKEAEANRARAEAGKAGAETAALGAQPGGPIDTQAQALVEGNMDPSQLSKRANTYGATLSAADKYSREKYGKPFDIAQAQSDYKFATNTQTQNTLKYLNSVIPNMADLEKQSDALGRTQFPPLNKPELWARLNAGSPQVAAYNATITEVSDQIAKILQGGGTGNGTSDAKLKQAQELFDKGFTANQIKATVGELSKLLDTRKTALIGDNRYLQKQYKVTPPKPAFQPPPNSVPVLVNNQIVGYSTDGGKSMVPVPKE